MTAVAAIDEKRDALELRSSESISTLLPRHHARIPTKVELDAMPKEQRARHQYDALKVYNYINKASALELGARFNDIEANNLYELVGFASFEDLVVDVMGQDAPRAHHAMRLTTNLELQFDSICKLSRSTLELLAKLPDDKKNDRKWSVLADEVAAAYDQSSEAGREEEEKMCRQIERQLGETPSHIETMKVVKARVPESLAAIWGRCKEVAIALEQQDGVSLKQAVIDEIWLERLLTDFLHAPYEKDPQFTNESLYDAVVHRQESAAKEADKKTRAELKLRQKEKDEQKKKAKADAKAAKSASKKKTGKKKAKKKVVEAVEAVEEDDGADVTAPED